VKIFQIFRFCSLLKESKKTDYEKCLEIWKSLSPEQQKFVTPRGKYIDSPKLSIRHLENDESGFAEIYDFNGDKKEGFLILAIRQDCQGKGIGTKILNKILKKAEKDGFEKIIYKTDPENISSQKLIKKITNYDVNKKGQYEWEINLGTHSSLFDDSNDKIVEEDEMNVSMLNPSAPMDNLGNGDSFATGDFRFPYIIGGIQKRNGTQKKKKKSKKKKTHS
jgi:predicted acetyltransferase